MNLGRRKSPAINSLGQGRLGPPSSSSPSSPAGNVTRLRRHSTLGTYVARRKATCAFSTVHNNNSVSTTTAYVFPYIHIYSRSSLIIHTLRSLEETPSHELHLRPFLFAHRKPQQQPAREFLTHRRILSRIRKEVTRDPISTNFFIPKNHRQIEPAHTIQIQEQDTTTGDLK
jgi:hypothetical protein